MKFHETQSQTFIVVDSGQRASEVGCAFDLLSDAKVHLAFLKGMNPGRDYIIKCLGGACKSAATKV